jgi:F-box-like
VSTQVFRQLTQESGEGLRSCNSDDELKLHRTGHVSCSRNNGFSCFSQRDYKILRVASGVSIIAQAQPTFHLKLPNCLFQRVFIGKMPAFAKYINYDPQIFAPSPKQALYDPSLDAAYSEMQYMDVEKFSSLLYALQTGGQLLTPPSSPIPDCGSPFDYVPNEILDQIIGCLHDDTSRGIYDVLRDISACRLVSRQFNDVATNWLYRHVPISDPYAFTKVSWFRQIVADLTVFVCHLTAAFEGAPCAHS